MCLLLSLFCSEVDADSFVIFVPVDLDDIRPANFTSVDWTHALSTGERILNALVAGHVATIQNDCIFVLLTSRADHLQSPLLILQHFVVGIKCTARHLMTATPSGTTLLKLALQLKIPCAHTRDLRLLLTEILVSLIKALFKGFVLSLELSNFCALVQFFLLELLQLHSHIIACLVIDLGLLLLLSDQLFGRIVLKFAFFKLLRQSFFFSCLLLKFLS